MNVTEERSTYICSRGSHVLVQGLVEYTVGCLEHNHVRSKNVKVVQRLQKTWVAGERHGAVANGDVEVVCETQSEL